MKYINMQDVLLNKLILYFYKGCHNFSLMQEDIEIMKWDWQDRFINMTLKNELIKKYPISSEFTRLFLKNIIQSLEPSQEVHDDFYTHLCNVMNEPISGFSYRHYMIGNNLNNIVIIKETKNMVVNGTTGMKTWEASFMLSDWALCNKDTFSNKNVLELGSGVGFAGITIGKLCKVKSLILSDCHDDVLKTACGNIEINFPHLLQEQTDEGFFFKDADKRLGVIMLDWTNAVNLSNTIVPDIIIGADIVYDPSILQPLSNVLKTFYGRNKNLEVYFSSVIRNEETFSKFLGTLNVSNFTYETIGLTKSVHIMWDENVKKSLLKIKIKL